MNNERCSMETCDMCNHNKYGTIKESGPLVDLRLVKNPIQRSMNPPKRVSITS